MGESVAEVTNERTQRDAELATRFARKDERTSLPPRLGSPLTGSPGNDLTMEARQARLAWQAEQRASRARGGGYVAPDMSWKKGDYKQLERAEEIAHYATAAPESKPWWRRYGLPTLNAAADFAAGVTLQIVQNNLDALTMVAPMPLQVRQNYHSSWDNIHSGRSVWYQAGRLVGGLVGIAQGIWEMLSGAATATGGTVVSCGTVVLCFAGGGAAVAVGSAIAVHGALVTSVSIVNTMRSGQAFFCFGEVCCNGE
ncbi:hypothetical protein D6779_02085 [Candidatus Parcubacteria bacterium]|nr:MAG: hypothetical protein D6779_02085 [Candidatus Parcubacteria bacterium]